MGAWNTATGATAPQPMGARSKATGPAAITTADTAVTGGLTTMAVVGRSVAATAVGAGDLMAMAVA